MEFILLMIGFFLLIKGADFFVDGSSSLARILKIPTVIIGLTIVAMGTSAPEASVSMNAAIIGNNDIAISNVVGSNIFNTLIVVGMCAFLMSFFVDDDISKRDLPINLMVSIALLVMFLDRTLSRLDGFVLLAGMLIYLCIMIVSALRNRTQENFNQTMSLPKSLLFMIVGLIAVIYGGDLVVDNASKIAKMFKMSQNFIGLTIVAIGTSLPELVTSIVATRKGESELALGNAVGSNIFNILFILGMSAIISPMSVLSESIIDGIVMIGVALLLLVFAKFKGKMGRKEGFMCIVLYVLYTLYLFVR